MNILLDTSAYSELHRGNETVLQVMRQAATVAVPSIVLGELYSGFKAGTKYSENSERLAKFLAKPTVRVVNVTEATALRYAEVNHYLRSKGKPIPTNDVWIAALALEHGFQLLTIDSHFHEIPMLLLRP